MADRFYIETTGWDGDALKSGIAWLLAYSAKQGHSTAAIALGIKDQIRRMEPALPAATSKDLQKHGTAVLLGQRIDAILDRKRPFEFSGPILAVWARDANLEKIEGLNPAAICAITWSAGNIDDWKATWGPTDLASGDAAPVIEVSNPVVEVALEGLTALVNLGTGITHPSDREAAISTFRVLDKAGEEYNVNEVRAWANTHGWKAEDAAELAHVAEQVSQGKRLRAGRAYLRDDIIDRWREEAARR